MEIQFYLLEEEKFITRFFDVQSNPFCVGDKIFLNVNKLRIDQTDCFKDSVKDKISKENIAL